MVSERIKRRIERLLDQVEEAADGQEWQRVQELGEEVLGLDADNSEAPAFLSAAERRLAGGAASTADVGPEHPHETVSPPVTAVDQPASFADGRYVVQRFLGEGGKKKVYLAHELSHHEGLSYSGSANPVRCRGRGLTQVEDGDYVGMRAEASHGLGFSGYAGP